MNLLFYSPSNAIGGAEISLLTLVKEFKRRGYTIYLALPKGKDTEYGDSIRPFVDEIFFIKSMPWIYYGNPNYLNRLFNYIYQTYKTKGGHLVSVLRFVWILSTKKIDISFSNTIYTFDLGMASWISGKKHIQFVREPISTNGEGLVKLKLRNSVFSKWLYGKLHYKIICNSNYTLIGCKSYFLENKVHVIYNPIESQTVEEKGDGKIPLKIIIVANLTSNWKNHEYVLYVASAVNKIDPNNQFKFYFYGSIPNPTTDYFEKLKILVKDFGLESKVTFEGLKCAKEIYENAFCMLHPSSLETFGRIYIEAMSAGVPVIAVEGGASNELISHLNNGILVDSQNYSMTSEWLIELFRNEVLRSELISNGLKFASKLSPRNIVDQIVLLLK